MTSPNRSITPGSSLIAIDSDRGPISCAYHPVPDAEAAVIMVGGGDGGLDGPAETLYPDLAADLQALGIGALRLDFRIHRFPGRVDEGVHDITAGIRYLLAKGCSRIGLLGHSFGGAVAIETAARETAVTSVATLATQTAGAQRVHELSPRPILFVHGLADIRLDPDCSRRLYRMAGEPKRLILYEGATHSLRQRREELRALLLNWFVDTLS